MNCAKGWRHQWDDAPHQGKGFGRLNGCDKELKKRAEGVEQGLVLEWITCVCAGIPILSPSQFRNDCLHFGVGHRFAREKSGIQLLYAQKKSPVRGSQA